MKKDALATDTTPLEVLAESVSPSQLEDKSLCKGGRGGSKFVTPGGREGAWG